MTTFTFNGMTLLDMAVSPLTPHDVQRFVNLIDARASEGSAFVARWSPDTGVCITATVHDGELVGWVMFPAADEQAARLQAMRLGEMAQAAMNQALGPVVAGAADAIAKAKGH